MADLVKKYLGDTGPDGVSKKTIKDAKKKYKTDDPAYKKHGIVGALDKMGWEDNPKYKKSARPSEKKNQGRGLTKD